MRLLMRLGQPSPSPSPSSGAVNAPWWYSGLMVAVGALLAVVIKMGYDEWVRRRALNREDDFRFIDQKRAAYIDLHAACQDVADAAHQDRVLSADKRRNNPNLGDQEIDAFNAEVDRSEERLTQGFRDLNKALATVDMIAPKKVAEAAIEYW